MIRQMNNEDLLLPAWVVKERARYAFMWQIKSETGESCALVVIHAFFSALNHLGQVLGSILGRCQHANERRRKLFRNRRGLGVREDR